MILYDDWVATGQYPDGTKLDPNDKNMEGYYKNYVTQVEKNKSEGNLALAKEIERQHGIIDTTTATEKEKEGYVEYVLGNEDLRENAEALGLTSQEMAEFGQTHYETFGVDQYIYDYDAGKVTDYGKNVEDRANYLTGASNVVVRDKEAFKRDYDISDEKFEEIIRDYGSADNWLYGTTTTPQGTTRTRSGDVSRMWEARDAIAKDFGGSDWNLLNFDAEGWNMSPDNPYAKGIRAGTIDVVEDVGQLIDTGDSKFLQDRYEDDYRANDFPDDWVDDSGTWQGPEDLGEYWNAISTAVRNEEGDLRSLIDSSQWATGYDFGGLPPGVSGLITNTGYEAPEFQDWSALAPTVFGDPQSELALATNLPAQQAMFGNKGAALQPWVPQGLVNTTSGGSPYTGGVQYTGGNPSLFDFNNQSNVVNNTGQAWTGPGGVTDFNAWQDAEYERMYPGRRAAAQAAGFAGINYFAPGAADWRASLPGGATSQDWVNMYGTQAQQAAGQTAAEQIAAGWIGDEDADVLAGVTDMQGWE